MERTVLLVDDEENIIAALTRVLRRDEYTILKAESGEKALDLLARHQVGVIISDQRMPGMTGTEFLSKAKELYPDTVRIVLSGYTDLNSITDAINQGAIYKFITKPWHDERVRSDVREGFERYEIKAENRRLAIELKEANETLSIINKNLALDVIKKTSEMSRSLQVLQMSQNILEHLPIGLVGIDADGLIVIANKVAHRLLSGGFEQLVGALAADVLAPELWRCYGASRDVSDTVLDLSETDRVSVHYLDLNSVSSSEGGMLVLMPSIGGEDR